MLRFARTPILAASAATLTWFTLTVAHASSPKFQPPIGVTADQVRAQVERVWVVINGEVYDLTEFGPRHPGGTPVLQKFAGKDASKAFNHIHRDPTVITKMLRPEEHIGPLIGSLDDSIQKVQDQTSPKHSSRL